MKTLKNPFFIVFTMVWLVVFTLTKLQIFLPNIIQFYLLDCLAVSVLANLGLWFLRIILQNNLLVLKLWQLLFVVFSVCVFFEIIMPIYKPSRYTADIYDVFCYFFGGLFFWVAMNKSGVKFPENYSNLNT